MNLSPIAVIHSPFKEKFSIPRQAYLIDVEMEIEFFTPFNRKEYFNGIEDFSHLWIIFLFHKVSINQIHPSVRPPRLGGNQKKGVFATRSPFRPNPIGMSAVKFLRIEENKIIIQGGDFLDQTPVLDIKPYLKESDSIKEAKCSWTDEVQETKLKVIFLNECDKKISILEKKAIEEILCLDPRPRYHNDEYKTYGSKIFNYDFHWHIKDKSLFITSIDYLNLNQP